MPGRTPLAVSLTCGLAVLGQAHAESLRPVAQASADAAVKQCLKAREAIAADTAADPAQFSEVNCSTPMPAHAFRYDRATGGSRLSRALSANEVVPAFPEFGTNAVHPGQALELVVSVGPVRIERAVVAMQTAHSGQQLFVRASNGEVLSVRYESLEQ